MRANSEPERIRFPYHSEVSSEPPARKSDLSTTTASSREKNSWTIAFPLSYPIPFTLSLSRFVYTFMYIYICELYIGGVWSGIDCWRSCCWEKFCGFWELGTHFPGLLALMVDSTWSNTFSLSFSLCASPVLWVWHLPVGFSMTSWRNRIFRSTVVDLWGGVRGFWYGHQRKCGIFVVWEEGKARVCVSDRFGVVGRVCLSSAGGGPETFEGQGSFMGWWGLFSIIGHFYVNRCLIGLMGCSDNVFWSF